MIESCEIQRQMKDEQKCFLTSTLGLSFVEAMILVGGVLTHAGQMLT